MTSQIDPSHPATGVAYTSAVRENFDIAANEISALQDAVASLQTIVAQLALGMAATTKTTPNPPNTSSTAMVCAGSGLQFTPVGNTRGMVIVEGTLGNTQNTSQSNLQLVWGTGTSPANGVLVSATNGAFIGEPKNMVSAKANDFTAFCATALLSGLTPGMQYWLDVGYCAVSGTATLSEMTANAFELLDPIS